MSNNDDVEITVLDQIANVLEKHNEAFAIQRKHLEKLSEEVAGLKKKVECLEAESSLDSSDVKIIAGVVGRLKTISSTLDARI